MHNYYVEDFGLKSTGVTTESVYQTNLTWQNPTELFSVQPVPGTGESGLFTGIAYDPTNQSLWVSGLQTLVGLSGLIVRRKRSATP